MPRGSRRHHILYDITSNEALTAALTTLAECEGVTFRTPRDAQSGTGRLDVGHTGPAIPVWRWRGTFQELRTDAARVLNELVYPLARSRNGACLAFPFPRRRLAPRPLTVERRRDLDLEDMDALFSSAARRGAAPATEQGERPETQILAGLDPDQRAAASHRRGPARVLAAAGSGKTRTMVARVAALVAGGVPPGSILVLAFNTEAALQLEERLEKLAVPTTRVMSPDADGVHCATFNAFGHRFQRQLLDDAPAIASSDAVHDRLLRAAVTRRRPPPRLPDRCAPASGVDADWPAIDPYDAAVADAAHGLAGALSAWRTRLTPPGVDLRTPAGEYAEALAARRLQTFDDQILATVTALLAVPARRRLVQELYSYVLVDEFQDVNPAQYALLDIVSRPWRDLFVVGDDDQLIYGWRAADVSTIVDFGAGLPAAPFTAYYTLPTNYRCGRQIVTRAERLVTNNRRRAQKTMRARPAAPEGAVLFAAAARPDDRLREAAAFLCLEQARLGCAWHDLAVLCRFRSQLDPAARVLRRWGVPTGPTRQPSGLDATCAQGLTAALHEATRDPLRAGTAAGPALEGILDMLATDPGGHLQTGLGAGEGDRDPPDRGAPSRGTKAVGPAPREDTAAWLPVADAARLLACGHGTLAGLAAAWRTLVPDAGPAPAASDGVTLATIHATKGREYAAVVVVDYAPALEPLTEEGREEERRVLYVALTRARERALLTIDTARGTPHRFLIELARPLDRHELRRLRRETTALRSRLALRLDELPPAVVSLIDGSAPQCRERHPYRPPRDLAQSAADYLVLRSRAAERRLAGDRGALERLIAWMG